MWEIIFIINPEVSKSNNCKLINKLVKIIIVKSFCVHFLIVILNWNIKNCFYLLAVPHQELK